MISEHIVARMSLLAGDIYISARENLIRVVDIKQITTQIAFPAHKPKTLFSEEVFTVGNISISVVYFVCGFADISESGSWEAVRADVLLQIKPQPLYYWSHTVVYLPPFAILDRYLFIQGRSGPARALTSHVPHQVKFKIHG